MNENSRLVRATLPQSMPFTAQVASGPALCQRETSMPSGREEAAEAAGAAAGERADGTATSPAVTARADSRRAGRSNARDRGTLWPSAVRPGPLSHPPWSTLCRWLRRRVLGRWLRLVRLVELVAQGDLTGVGAGPADGQLAQRTELLEADGAVPEKLEQREEAGHHHQGRVSLGGERAEGRRPAAAQHLDDQRRLLAH